MKSNVPWSVKGIDPEARVVAKAAAKEAGMTLGEWMNQAIRVVGEGDGQDADPGEAAIAPVAGVGAPGITTEQLRAVVDSLNRLNERLTSTEEGLRTQEAQTRQTAAGLGQGLETVFERMKRIERERREGTPDAIAERVEKLERGEGDKGRIDGLKRLESALTSMVEALEVTRAEAITKIAENEDAVAELASRVDVLDDKLTAGFAEVHGAIDAVGEHLDRTERTAAGVLSDAKAASGSTDAAFVQQTAKRLQALGNEIKRSGDQIRGVEEMVGRLSAKIEAAEHRSAEGIGEVAASLETLRTEIGAERGPVDADEPHREAEDALAEAAREADRKVSRLQRSYETMMARLEGRPAAPDDEAAVGDGPDREDATVTGAADAAPGDAADGAEVEGRRDEAQGAAAFEDAVPRDEAPEDIVPAEGQDEEFDRAFADLGTDEPDMPPRLDGAAPLAAAPLAAAPLATGPGPAATAPLGDEDAGTGATGEGAVDVGKLTARQKVLLAARARKRRLEAEREDAPVETPSEQSEAPSPAEEDIVGEVRPEGRDGGQNRKLGAGFLGLLAVLALAVAYAGWNFFGRDGDASVAAAPAPIRAGAEAPRLPAPNEPVTLPTATADAALLYGQGKDLLARGEDEESFRLFREAADQGYVPAQFRVGYAYYEGVGVEKDVQRAYEKLNDAAVSGNVLAMHYLGNINVTDEAVGPNIDAALDWFERAADGGVVSSAYNLGYLYDPTVEEGLMPMDKRDAGQSYYWFRIAAKQGDEPARQEAELVAARLTPEKIAQMDALVARWSPLPVSETVNDGVRLPG